MKYISKRNIITIFSIVFVLAVFLINLKIYLNKNKTNDIASIKAIKYTEQSKNIIT